ncbi:g10196 [Coccomyxa elongata]
MLFAACSTRTEGFHCKQLVDASLPDISSEDEEFDNIATAFMDEQLLKAINLVNMDLEQETRQVVLLGCGLDTRPYRLPWPGGTVLFEVAGTDAHALAVSRLKAAGAHVPRACLLRRVSATLGSDAGFAASLSRAGLRGDRLSLWALQGLAGLGLDRAALQNIFTDVASVAAFGSILVGELPVMSRSEAEDVLAEFGFLGRVISAYQLSKPDRDQVETSQQEGQAEKAQRWLFIAQCQQRSLEEMTTYADHVAAMEEAGEDFFGNFS